MSGSFSYKLTTENELFTFDYSSIIAATETILTATCKVQVKEGFDETPNAILQGSPAIATPRVTQRVAGGISGNTYRLEMTVTTSYSNVYTLVGDLPIYTPLEV